MQRTPERRGREEDSEPQKVTVSLFQIRHGRFEELHLDADVDTSACQKDTQARLLRTREFTLELLCIAFSKVAARRIRGLRNDAWKLEPRNTLAPILSCSKLLPACHISPPSNPLNVARTLSYPTNTYRHSYLRNSCLKRLNT